ncbi:MAG: pilus assembly protein PilM [Candidatus Omnitrophica bacterium]|nr:pilus assembly protein PilM [Candidatus Omnitrophota bacterium]
MSANVFTTIEITDTHIKLLQAKTVRHKRVVCACDVRLLSDFTDKELIDKLSEITTFLDAPRGNLTVVIPRRLAILKSMRLPSQNEAELRKMIALQLVDQIPYAVEDVVYDFVVLDKEPSGYIRLLIIVVHREISDRFFRICREAGLQPEKFVLSSYGILQWLEYQQASPVKPAKIQASAGQPVLLVNIDAGHTEICFCHQHKLLFSRSVNYGARDLTADPKSGLAGQIDLSLKNYHKENLGPSVKRILVLSTMPEAALLKGRLEEMSLIPVDFHSPSDNILCQKDFNWAAVKNHPGLSLTVLLGIVLSDGKDLVNLIPQEVRTNKRSRQRKVQWAQSILMFALTCLLTLSIPGIEFFRKVAYLRGLEEKIEKFKPELEKIRKKQQVVAALQEDLGRRVSITDLLQELYRIAPAELSFQSLSLDERGRFVIHGYAETSAGVHTFQENLVQSRRFKGVNLEFATKRKIFNREVTDFQITSMINTAHD